MLKKPLIFLEAFSFTIFHKKNRELLIFSIHIMKNLHYPLLMYLVLLVQNLYSQNTIGTTLNTTDSFNGYTLITPSSNAIPNFTYLIDNCGQVINTWQSEFVGQGADEIRTNGDLYRGAVDNQSTLLYAGNNGRLEHYNWEGDLVWSLTYSDTDFSFHHDYAVLENGNIILIVAERMTFDEAVEAGRDPETLIDNELYTERIVEINPIGSNDFEIVWEWNLWDHLVQDFDASKDNFGIIANEPGKLDINFTGFSNDNADWTHFNAIDYNETLDQIMISARFTNEIYIIDHSTTTEEASTTSGGNSNRGGEFLYRWGNPQAYDRGTEDDQRLYGQHSPHWITEGLPNEGDILIFNNGFMRGFTTVDILDAPTPDADGNYPLLETEPYVPIDATIVYQDENPTDFFAPFLSGAQQLPNGNFLIDNGPIGQVFETNTDQEIVWEYVSPVTLNDGVLSQGDNPPLINSRLFRAFRYALDYEGFEGRDLSPQDPIELNPNLDNCALLSLNDVENTVSLTVYPNPVINTLSINSTEIIDRYAIYSLNGSEITKGNSSTVDVSKLSQGVYFISIDIAEKSIIKRFIKS